MKLFCNCNSNWIISIDDKCTTRQIVTDMFQKGISARECEKCTYNPWIDADYENMMHDLKQMNS